LPLREGFGFAGVACWGGGIVIVEHTHGAIILSGKLVGASLRGRFA
jgi:hypothetical protein